MITKPKPGFLINPLHPLSRGLVGWWLFNEGGGPTAFDYSGKGNHGTLTNMDLSNVWRGSPRGGSLFFANAGVDTHVDLGNNPDLRPTSFFTVTAWIKPVFDGTVRTIYSAGDQVDNHWRINLTSSDRLRHIEDGGSQTLGPSGTLTEGWHFVGVTKNGDTGVNLSLFQEGVLVATNSVFDSPTGGGSKIGIESTFAEFRGHIDDVRLWKRPLSSLEILQVYNNPYANVISPLSSVNRVNGFLSSSGVGNIGKLIRRRRRMHG